MNKKIQACMAFVLLAMSFGVQAKTVALWPLGFSGSGPDPRCALNVANDLTLSGASFSATETPGWSLPSNPDTSVFLFDPVLPGQVAKASSASQFGRVSTMSDPLFDAVGANTYCTIEGWFRYDALPADGAWSVFYLSDVGRGRIMFSLRSIKNATSGEYETKLGTYVGFAGDHGADLFSDPIANPEATLLGKWHHIAFVHCMEGVWRKARVYLDGEIVIDSTIGTLKTCGNDRNMYLGGGRNDHPFTGALAYWRVSDEPLAPAQFLCAAGTGPYGAVSPKTLAYWPLRRAADGTLDLVDKAGHADLQPVTFSSAGLTIERGVAPFTGEPPNPNVPFATATQGAHCSQGNRDSLGAWSYPSYSSIYKLTERVGGTASRFTVECYYCPALREQSLAHLVPTDDSVATFLTTIPSGTTTNGWALQVVRDAKGVKGGTSHWRIVCLDTDSVDGVTSTYVANGDFAGGSFVEGDNIWRHIALTYDKSLGTAGRWELFVDGISCGTVDNVRECLSQGSADTKKNAYLGGNGTLPGQVYGYFDCFAMAESVLTPAQFICTKNGTAATRKCVVPLETDTISPPALFLAGVNGETYFYFDGGAENAAHVPALYAGAGPTVTNPDPLFSQAGVTGAAAYQDGANRTKALLRTRDERVLNLLNEGKNDVTLEGYFRRNAAIGSAWDLTFTCNGVNGQFMTSFRPNNMIYLWDYAANMAADKKFQLESWQDNTWVHFAWVRKNRAWTVYKDGQEVGTVSGSLSKNMKAYELILGGRYTEHIWRGEIAEVRISSAALAPEEFLCAASQTHYAPLPAVSAGTQAFWYLDNAEGAAYLANAAMPAGGGAFSGTATGSDAVAMSRASRRADDSALFDDSGKPNVGSVSASSALTADRLGGRLEVTSAFTVEGWVKPAATLATEHFLCGTWNGSTGWKVSLVPGTDGAASVKLHAESAYNLFADETLADVIPAVKVADWFNVAITYDPALGNGTWTVYVDGTAVGSVQNRVKPFFAECSASDFSLGAECAYDVWRVSRGVRTTETMLWKLRKGFAMLFF